MADFANGVVLEGSSTYEYAISMVLFPCRNHKGHAPVRPGPYYGYLSPSKGV